MLKRYNIKAGLIFAILISALSSFPRLVRFDFNLVSSFSGTFVYLFISFFGCWLIHHFFQLNHFSASWLRNNTIKALTGILTSLIFIVIITYVFNTVSVLPLGGISPDKLSSYQVFSIRLFRGVVISVFVFFVVYYFRMMVTLQRSKLENEYLKQENLKAQLASLREQISPHFLFNSLNTLSALSHESKVKEYILKMSDVYRYVLHYQTQNETTVKEELDFIRSYIYILESRFEEGLKIKIGISENKMSRKIIPLAMQLLIENAIKHNSVSYQHPLLIDIYEKEEWLVVENDFRPKESLEKHSGTGLNNLSERYLLICGKGVIISQTSIKFKVEIPFLA